MMDLEAIKDRNNPIQSMEYILKFLITQAKLRDTRDDEASVLLDCAKEIAEFLAAQELL